MSGVFMLTLVPELVVELPYPQKHLSPSLADLHLVIDLP